MPCLHHLGRAAWLLSLCLLLAQSHLRAAALPTGRGQEEEARPGGGGDNDRESPQPENSPAGRGILPGPLGPEDQKRGGPDDGDLFQDVDPKALAAVLLQALQAEAGKPSSGQNLNPEPSANEERVRSETKSSGAQEQLDKKAQGPGWEPGEDGGRKQEGLEAQGEAGEISFGQQELDALKSMLEELQRYSSAAKRAEPPQERDEVLKELEEYERLRAPAKRSQAPPGGEPWDGARKLRQQQHLEHQLLQRRYEELAESRRQAEEARRAAAEEERLADMASDLLLQYLLKDGEEEEDGRQGANAQEEDEDEEEQQQQRSGIRRKGSGLLFEDEEGNVAEDKRSNEAPVEEDDDDDIDPNTIDRLIELSSKLHLPADDVIDIINNVEKKKKEVPEVVPAGSKAKGPGAPPLQPPPPRNKPKKAPAYAVYRPEPRPPQKPYYPPADYKAYHHHRLPKQNEAAWNEVLKGDEYPAPKWYPARLSGGSSSSHRGGGGSSNYAGSNKISNYINPRTFQPPPYARYLSPVVPREEYYDDGQARQEEDGGSEDEELQNYIETMLMKRPKAFQ